MSFNDFKCISNINIGLYGILTERLSVAHTLGYVLIKFSHLMKIEGIYMRKRWCLKCHPMANKFKSQIGIKPVVEKEIGLEWKPEERER